MTGTLTVAGSTLAECTEIAQREALRIHGYDHVTVELDGWINTVNALDGTVLIIEATFLVTTEPPEVRFCE